MTTVGVVCDLNLLGAVVGVPQLLGLGGVVLTAGLAGVLAVAGHGRGNEALGRGLRAEEDLVGHLLAVDRHGQGLADVDVRELLLERREADELEGRTRALLETIAQVTGGRREALDRDGGLHVVVTGDQVGVLGLLVLVDLEVDAVDLGHGALEAVDLFHFDLRVVLPGALHLEGTVADDRVLEAVGDDAGSREGGVGQRQERRVTHDRLPAGERRRQRHGERGVVDLLQTGERLGLGLGGLLRALLAVRVDGLQVGVALDTLEEVRRTLGVGTVGAVVPGVDVAVGGNRLAVAEGEARLELHRPDLVVVRGDRLGRDQLRVVLVVEVDKRVEQRGQNLRTAGLRRIGRDQVLRLSDADDDRVAGRVAVFRPTARTSSGQQGDGGRADRHLPWAIPKHGRVSFRGRSRGVV